MFRSKFFYPRFFSGLNLFAVLILGVTTEDLNSSPGWASRADFAARSFDSLNVLSAAFAFLLSLFFSFGIILIPIDFFRSSLRRQPHHHYRRWSLVPALSPVAVRQKRYVRGLRAKRI